MLCVCARVCEVYRYAVIRVVGRTDGLGLDSDILLSDLHTLKLYTGVPSGSPNGARLNDNTTGVCRH